jgi:signal transduction histidine kinase
MTSEADEYWTTPLGGFLLQLSQDTISECLGVPLRILREDAIDAVAVHLARKNGRVGTDQEHIKAFRSEVMDRLAGIRSPDDERACATFGKCLSDHHDSFRCWGIDMSDPDWVDVPGTDLKQLWKVGSVRWVWRTDYSNHTPFHRTLITSYPKLRLVCRLQHMKALDDRSKMSPADANQPLMGHCLFGMNECLVGTPLGVLLTGPVWARESDEGANSLRKRIEDAISYLSCLDTSLAEDRDPVLALAYKSPPLESKVLERVAGLAAGCLGSLNDLVAATDPDLLDDLDASEWVRLVQFVLFFHQERALVEALLKDRCKAWRFHRALSREVPNGRIVGVDLGTDAQAAIRAEIFSSAKEAKEAGYQSVRESALNETGLLRDYDLHVGQNRVLSELQRTSYLHRCFSHLVLHDPDHENDILLHRLKALVNADVAAFYTYDPVKECLRLTGICFEPLTGTRELKAPNLREKVDAVLRDWPKGQANTHLLNAVKTYRHTSCSEGTGACGALAPIRSWILVPARHMGRVFGLYLLAGLRSKQFRHRAGEFLDRASLAASPYLFRARLSSRLGALFPSALVAYATSQLENERYPRYDKLCEELSEIFSAVGASLWLMRDSGDLEWHGDGGQARPSERYVIAGRHGAFLDQSAPELPAAWVSTLARANHRKIIRLENVDLETDPEVRAFCTLAGKELTRHVLVPVAAPPADPREGGLAYLVLHDRQDPSRFPQAAEDMLRFVAGQLGVVLQAVQASRLQQQTYLAWIGHELAQNLNGICNHAHTLQVRGTRIVKDWEILRHTIDPMLKRLAAGEALSDEQLNSLNAWTAKETLRLERNFSAGLDDLQQLAEDTLGFTAAFEAGTSAEAMRQGRDPLIAGYYRVYRSTPLERPLDLYKQIQSVLQTTVPRESGLSWNVDPLLREFPTVWLYPRQFAQVFRNLADNARKNTPPGHQIEVTGRYGPVDIEIDVINLGHCIDLAEREQIFRAKVRGRHSAEMKLSEMTSGKSGLGSRGQGLYIARGIAREWGGDVTLVGSVAHGNYQEHTFRIYIPYFRVRINEYGRTTS